MGKSIQVTISNYDVGQIASTIPAGMRLFGIKTVADLIKLSQNFLVNAEMKRDMNLGLKQRGMDAKVNDYSMSEAGSEGKILITM